jgi:hypothetical protein
VTLGTGVVYVRGFFSLGAFRGIMAEQAHAGDGVQPTPRCARLRLPAAPEAWRCYDFQCQELATDVFACSWSSCPSSIGRAGARKKRRLILLLSVGWVPLYLRPSGACLDLGTRVSFSLLTPSRIAPNRGCSSSEAQAKPRENGFRPFNGLGLWGQRYLLGNGPHKRAQFPGDGDDD